MVEVSYHSDVSDYKNPISIDESKNGQETGRNNKTKPKVGLIFNL